MAAPAAASASGSSADAELTPDAASQASEGACLVKVAQLMRVWNPEFLDGQLDHAVTMDKMPACKVRRHAGRCGVCRCSHSAVLRSLSAPSRSNSRT